MLQYLDAVVNRLLGGVLGEHCRPCVCMYSIRVQHAYLDLALQNVEHYLPSLNVIAEANCYFEL